MIKLGLSESEILEVCRNPTQSFEEKITEKPSKPEEDKPKVPLNYSNKLGVRSNVGSLTTTHLNPPKNSNTRVYFLYGQIVNSEEKRKLTSLHTLDNFKFSGKFVGIDNRLSEDNLHYVSLLYSSQNVNVHQRTRLDSTTYSGIYYNQIYTEQNIISETMTLEYVHHLLDDLLVGLSYNSVSLIRDIKFDYQWYKSEDDSKYEGNGGTVEYESNHDYNYNSLRLQKVKNNLRFDFVYIPEVTSKENYSGDFTGESKTGSGRFFGLNVTRLGYKYDFSLGYYKENENLDINDPENVSYLWGYNYFSPNIVFRGIIDYTKSEKLSGSNHPFTEIDIEGILSLFNTYEFIYEYINIKYDDIGESSDKYRITESNINLLGFGVNFDL